MDNYSRAGGLLSIIILLTGCMARGPVFLESKATEVKPGYALVYIYRVFAVPRTEASTVTIDRRPVVQLKNYGFSWFYAKPGNREIKAFWNPDSHHENPIISLNILDGKTYYIQLFGEILKSSLDIITVFNIPVLIGSNTMQSQLLIVDSEKAKVLMEENCKFQKPFSLIY
ncbi:MAG: hypothetical protein PHI34_12410 [Acidobacteriota bacterium]|nr:hypothetical protein [Acidobacteriota bacterium]